MRAQPSLDTYDSTINMAAMSDIQSAADADHPATNLQITTLESELFEIIFAGLLETHGGEDAGTDLFEAGMDSMAIMQLLILIEDKFRIQIPAHEVNTTNFKSVRALAQLLWRVAPEQVCKVG